MRLISLRLRNFRGYDDCRIEFPDGLVGIAGPNGAGKTTLAEAVGWALFGKRRPGARVDELRRQDGSGPAFAELVFQLEETIYRVERTAGGGAHLWIGSDDEPEASGVRNTTQRVIQELGLTWEVFERTVFAQQKDVEALSPQSSKEKRQAHIERLLGLARFKRAAEAARGDAKAIENEIRGRLAEAPDPADLRTQLRDAEKAAEKSSPKVTQAELEVEEAKAELKRARAAVEAEQERTREADGLKSDLKHGTETAERAERAAASVEAKLTERDEKRKRLDAIARDAARSEEAKVSAQRWEALATADREVEEAKKEVGALTHNPEEANERVKRVNDLTRRRRRISERREKAESRTSQLAARVKALRAAESAGEVADRQSELRDARATERRLSDRIAVLEAELEHDHSHLDEVASGGADTPCPVCRRPYGEEYDAILAGYRTRIKEAERQLPKLRGELKRTEAAREKTERRLSDARAAERDLERTTGPATLATAERQLDEAKAQHEELGRELEEIDSGLPTLERQVADDTSKGRTWSAKKAVLEEREARFREAAGALGVERYRMREHDGAVAAAERLAELAAEAAHLETEIGAAEGLGAELEEHRSLARQARAEEQRVRKQLESLALDPKLLKKLKTACEKAEKRRDDAADKLGDAKSEARERSAEVRGLRKRVEEATRVHEGIRRRRVEQRQHQLAANVLNDYRAHEARRAWPHLEREASAILAAATEGRYADIRLSDDYRIHVVDRGEEHRLDRYSGGEQDLANLCLRLAIAEWVARERGVQLSFLILDEVFGSQDDERRSRLVDELRALTGRFRQVLIITHVPEVAEFCDSQIEVSAPEQGASVAALAT